MDKTSFVYTKESSCMGCNKCIFMCPTNANEAFFEADEGKVFIKPGFCISCGECINICDHGARDFIDDTNKFLDDLKNGEKISVVIAPAARFNFPSTKKLISYLKSIGVNQVYDVSFGADICTWGHVKAINEQNLSGLIAQPCPVVVSYIEKYKPSLISRLSPIHSPVLCLATYLKKYAKLEDKLMFLSPCIGKKRECTSEHTHGVLEYNVSFTKFIDVMKSANVDLESYSESEFDNAKGSIGFTFPRPGGLSENIKLHLGQDIWIKQIEGIGKIKEYFEEYTLDLKDGNPVPVIVDALNCEHGCNLGTGTLQTARLNSIDHALNSSKSAVTQDNTDKLMKFFDDNFVLDDFIRKYMDRSFDYKIDETVDLEKAFISLGKITKADRNINCFSCGYGNCRDFAYDLALGHNNKNNCKHYLLNKFKKLSLYDDLTGLNNRYCYHLAIAKFRETHPGIIGIAYIDINGLKEANDIRGHSFGDTLIITCADLLKKVFGGNAYRIGGDEFIIMDSSANEATFNIKISSLHLLLEKEPDLVVSIGTAISSSPQDLDDKLDEADQAMYKAKQEYYTNIRKADRRTYRKRMH